MLGCGGRMGLEAGRSGMLGGTKSGQNCVSGAWLALRLVLIRLVFRRRAEVLRWAICDQLRAGVKEAGLGLHPVGLGGPCVWAGVLPGTPGFDWWCGAGGACLVGGGAGVAVGFGFFPGLVGSGDLSRNGGAGVASRGGCQGLPCGSAAAAAMLWEWSSSESGSSSLLIEGSRQPCCQSGGGAPVRSQRSSALCRASMWSRVMQPYGMSWGCLLPKRRCRVVLMANVPHDHGGRGPSSCVAILWICLYVGRVGGRIPA